MSLMIPYQELSFPLCDGQGPTGTDRDGVRMDSVWTVSFRTYLVELSFGIEILCRSF